MTVHDLWSELKDLSSSDLVVPVDLVVVLLSLAMADVLLLGIPSDVPPVRAAVGLPVLLFAPGYVITAALFPRGNTGDRPPRDRTFAVRDRPIRWSERLALSFGTSIALIPLLSLLHGPIVGSLSPESTLLGLNGLVLAGALGAAVQRNRVPVEQRFRVRFQQWPRKVRRAIGAGNRSIDSGLSMLLLAVVLVAVVTLGFVIVAPQQGETYTNFNLLAANDTGDAVASNYPTGIGTDEPVRLTLRIENNEREETSYTIVVAIEEGVTEGNLTSIVSRRSVERINTSIQPGDTWSENHSVRIPPGYDERDDSAEDVRLSYYLYKGEAPQDPDSDTAYRHLYLWTENLDSE